MSDAEFITTLPEELRAEATEASKASAGKCSCGSEGSLCIDPYDEDIYGKTVFRVLCKYCYDQACGDI